MRRLGALALLLAACRGAAPYTPPAPDLPLAWSTPVADGEVERAWWRRFGDPELDRLVERALAENLELAVAEARLREARAVLGVVAGEARPRGDLGAAAGRREPSTAVAGGEFLPADDAAFHSLGLDVRWELDLFGRRAHAVDAAEAELDATRARADGARLRVLAEVARLYCEARGWAAEEALRQRQLELAQRTLVRVEARVRAGLADERAALVAREERAALAAELPRLAAERRARELALGVLLALRADEQEAFAAGARAPAQPSAPPEIARGRPLELLARRPDLRVAERAVARAWAEGRQAEAELYPVLSLDAALGVESESFADLFTGAARTFSLGPSLTAPLFRGGVLRWAVRARDAREEAARLEYEGAVLAALSEVEDGWTRFQRQGERLREVEDLGARRAARTALVRARAAAGLEAEQAADEAELQELAAELALVAERTALNLDAIRLYKALGGGWEDSDPGT